jgi:two-component system chemotaxis response regulator CheB
VRYRCRVGHAYSPDSLLAEKSEALEAALWAALSFRERSAALSTRLHRRALESGHKAAAARFLEHAKDAEERAGLIRSVLASGRGVSVRELNGDLGGGGHGSSVNVGSEP